MGRPRKRKLPASVPLPTRKIAEIEARRSIIWELMLMGASDNATILRTLAQHDPPYRVSVETVIADKHALDAAASEHFQKEREHLAARYLAKLDRLQQKLENTAKQAEQGDGKEVTTTVGRDGEEKEVVTYRLKPSLMAKIQALNAARQAVMDAGKMAGVVVEKTEHSGTVANLNVEATPEDIADLKRALEHSGTSL